MRSPDRRVGACATSTPAPAGRRAAASRAACTLALALTTGACSVSYPLYDKTDDIKTGSIGETAAAPQPKTDIVASTPLAPPPGAVAAAAPGPAMPAAYVATRPAAVVAEPAITPSDWAYARGALSLAMVAETVNASVPWANPDTGAYGAFSASAGAVEERGATCRPFAASHSAGGREQRLEGTACRTAAGYWEAVAIKATATRVL